MVEIVFWVFGDMIVIVDKGDAHDGAFANKIYQCNRILLKAFVAVLAEEMGRVGSANARVQASMELSERSYKRPRYTSFDP